LALYSGHLGEGAQGSEDITERGATESKEEEGFGKQRVFALVFVI